MFNLKSRTWPVVLTFIILFILILFRTLLKHFWDVWLLCEITLQMFSFDFHLISLVSMRNIWDTTEISRANFSFLQGVSERWMPTVQFLPRGSSTASCCCVMSASLCFKATHILFECMQTLTQMFSPHTLKTIVHTCMFKNYYSIRKPPGAI